MSSNNKKKRVFKAKMKHCPSEVRGSITHGYLTPDAKMAQVVEKDMLYFLANPSAESYRRAYVPGEFEGVPLPDGVDLAEVDFVQVIRIGEGHQARLPIPKEK